MSAGRLRGVDATAPRHNRFRRLTTLCGISVREAADYLEITPGTAEQKMLGKRGIVESEERRLAGLWRRIRTGDVDGTDPPAAVRQALAHREAATIRAGGDPDEIVDDWNETRRDEGG